MCANQGSLHRASEWASPPELTLSSTPRPVRLTVPRVLVWSVVPAMLLILLSVAVSLRLRRQHAFVQRMATKGVVTNGKVAFVKGSFSGSSLTAGKYTYYVVGYRFQVDGETHSASTPVTPSDAMGLWKDGGVQVRYLRTDPARSWIVGREPYHFGRFGAYLIYFVTVSGFLAILFMIWDIKLQRPAL